MQNFAIQGALDENTDMVVLAGGRLESLGALRAAIEADDVTGGDEIESLRTLDRVAEKLDELEVEPRFQAEILVSMSRVYRQRGLDQEALPPLERALAIRRRPAAADQRQQRKGAHAGEEALFPRLAGGVLTLQADQETDGQRGSETVEELEIRPGGGGRLERPWGVTRPLAAAPRVRLEYT